MKNTYANHVSFKASFITEHTPSSPAGKDLLLALINELEEHMVQVKEYTSTDYSHRAYVIFKDICICLEAGAVGDKNAQWLIFFNVRHSLFGLRKITLNGKLSEFSDVLHQSLSKLVGVQEIRWYKNAHVWNHHAEEKYWSSPHA